MSRWVAVVALSSVIACGVPPLRHRLGAGSEPYVIFVADAPDGRGDIWAVAPGGGAPIQVTFSLPAEFGAALAPDGIQIAFIRSRTESDTTLRQLAVINLLNGAERALPLPDGAGYPLAVAWARHGRGVIVRTTNGLWRLETPPAEPDGVPVAAVERAAAESLFSVYVGEPVFARIAPCDNPSDLCVVDDSGSTALAPGASQPLRWGSDSVAYLVGDELIVRSLGPGRSRVIRLSGMRNPRDFSFFPGSGKREAVSGER